MSKVYSLRRSFLLGESALEERLELLLRMHGVEFSPPVTMEWLREQLPAHKVHVVELDFLQDMVLVNVSRLTLRLALSLLWRGHLMPTRFIVLRSPVWIVQKLFY